MPDTIYDFGMNNGDDVDYYLKKDCHVVGVEANPALCELVRINFADQISEGRLTVLNAAIVAEPSDRPVTFYLHKSLHVLSQVQLPERPSEFEPIEVPARTASGIVAEFGKPHYIKIDLEGLDADILQELFDHQIFPDFISAEAHTAKGFGILLAAGYDAFNLIDGSTVGLRFGAAPIHTLNGLVIHHFKPQSSGPFGNDIPTTWLNGSAFLHFLGDCRLGWKDIHASRVIEPVRKYHSPRQLNFREHLKDIGPSLVRAVRRRVLRER